MAGAREQRQLDDRGLYEPLRASEQHEPPLRIRERQQAAAAPGSRGGTSRPSFDRRASSASAGVVQRRIVSPGTAARQTGNQQRSQAIVARNPKPKLKPKHILTGQQGRSLISKERFVPLTVDDSDSAAVVPESPDEGSFQQSTHSIFQDIEAFRARGRVTIFCLAESTNLVMLESLLVSSPHSDQGKMEKFPEVIYAQYQRISGGDSDEGDIFFFDYGVIACWGLDEDEEKEVLRFCHDCMVEPLEEEAVEIDELTYQYTQSEKPHIQNDIVTLNHRFANIHEVKMAICHAFAQSTKLALFEEQVQTLVEDTRELPERLAEEGEVHMDRKDINKLIGQVFLQKAAVNLLSTVLDTPEYFWSAPDSLQALYKRVCDYLEMDDRVDLLNRRFSVLQEMLDMLRDQTNNAHGARLEWIVIWLIVVEVVIGIFECMSILGWVGPKHSR